MAADNGRMTFATSGFLSDEAQRVAAEARLTFADLYALAYDCSSLAMEIAAHLPSLEKDEHVVAGSLFARAVTQFQAALILAERGLPLDSMTQGRALIETVFVLGALADDKVSLEQLADSDFAHRKKMGNALLPTAKENDPRTEKLKLFVAEHAGKSPIPFEVLANAAGLRGLYDVFYRHLSHFAAHPSLTASGAHAQWLPSGELRASLRPDFAATPKALISACRSLLVAFVKFDPLVEASPEMRDRVMECHEREKALYEKYRPWATEGPSAEDGAPS